MTRQITVNGPGGPGAIPRRARRARWMRTLGVRLHPQEVTDAWYLAECPPRFQPPVGRVIRAQWHLACLFRGAR
jgi:hypothetical protein